MKTVWVEMDYTYEKGQIIAVYASFPVLCRKIYGYDFADKVSWSDAMTADHSGEYKFTHNGYERIAKKMQVWE